MNLDAFILQVIQEELTILLQDYTKELKKNLQDSGKLASGQLYNSIMFEVSGIVGIVRMEDYADFVDQGRAPGKFPPPPAIREWIETKGLELNDSNASLETQRDQLTYLIGRKIAREGIPPTNFITDPNVTDFENRAQQRIETYIQQQIEGI